MNQEPAPKPVQEESAQKPKMPVEQQPQRIDKLHGFLENLVKRHPQTAEQSGQEQIPFLHGEIALNAFKKEFPDSPEKIVLMKKVLDAFFDQEMENTAIFTDSAGASLPYTKIEITKLAQEITGISTTQPEEPPKHKRVLFFLHFPNFKTATSSPLLKWLSSRQCVTFQ